MTESYDVLGQTVSMPVEIRLANAFTAVYSVNADAAQRAIDYSGLEILRFRPGRGMCCLVFVNYVDGDLGPYNEFGVAFMVRKHTGSGVAKLTGNSQLADLKALATGNYGVLIHRLPVDGEFTMAAGRGIWGFPKVLADFEADHTSPTRRGLVRIDGSEVAELTVREGFPVPGQGTRMSIAAYSHLDGVTRCVPWQMRPSGLRSRIGGATLRLGSHPWADELAGLEMSRRALFTSAIPTLGMTFEDAEII
ncbi:acetoacetate decarboxylase family protein [Aldersonia sp. NBC_00410]|uniref:acetoacetate decarboxylase family protein n=1 Tax=Aldersonia sp. NBC_00410 TaxID=2975954 RepID=UPI00224EEFBC|nr:acetoacetate decarboxylase family protein [Aldersonia sp. NBC_00410]MCX5043318.1 acetoacetate decarboxylase family protein [Aldersonia sp. NBC_00410]